MADGQPVLLLTGASRGIGHAAVKTLQRRRLARADDLPPAVRSALPVGGRSPQPHPARPVRYRQVYAAIPRIRDIAEGRLDALINNAAVSPKTPDGARCPAWRCRTPTGCTSST